MPQPLTPTAPVTGIGQSIYNAANELQTRKRALLATSDPSSPYNQANRAASLGVLALSNPSHPLYAAKTNAERSLLGAQGQQTQQTRNYYTTNGGFIAARQGEDQALTTATHDTADLSAVAQAQGQRSAVNRLRDSVGIARPLEINTNQDDTTPLPVGVARSLRPNADYIAVANQEKDRARGFTLENLRNDLNLTGTNVDDLKRQGAIAGLNLDEARAGAGYTSKMAGFNLGNEVDQAQYGQGVSAQDLEAANLAAKYSGLVPYDDPEHPTGVPQYITPAEKDRRDFQYSQATGLQRIPQQYATNQARTQYSTQQESGGSELAALPDAQVLNQLSSFDPTSFATVRAELIRRAMAPPHHYNQAQAEAYADNAIAAEMGTRQRVATQAASGYPRTGQQPTVTVNVP